MCSPQVPPGSQSQGWPELGWVGRGQQILQMESHRTSPSGVRNQRPVSEAVADTTDAPGPVPTVKGPFVYTSPTRGSWVSSDSILIKYSEMGVEHGA